MGNKRPGAFPARPAFSFGLAEALLPVAKVDESCALPTRVVALILVAHGAVLS